MYYGAGASKRIYLRPGRPGWDLYRFVRFCLKWIVVAVLVVMLWNLLTGSAAVDHPNTLSTINLWS